MFTNYGNRRKAMAAVRLSVLLRGGLLVALVGMTGLGYVWQKNQIYQMGNQIRQQERELEGLRKKQAVLRVQVAELKSPRFLWAKCQHWNLGLLVPRDAQVVRLPEPTVPISIQPIFMTETERPSTSSKEIAQNRQMSRHRGG